MRRTRVLLTVEPDNSFLGRNPTNYSYQVSRNSVGSHWDCGSQRMQIGPNIRRDQLLGVRLPVLGF